MVIVKNKQKNIRQRKKEKLNRMYITGVTSRILYNKDIEFEKCLTKLNKVETHGQYRDLIILYMYGFQKFLRTLEKKFETQSFKHTPRVLRYFFTLLEVLQKLSPSNISKVPV